MAEFLYEWMNECVLLHVYDSADTQKQEKQQLEIK